MNLGAVIGEVRPGGHIGHSHSVAVEKAVAAARLVPALLVELNFLHDVAPSTAAVGCVTVALWSSASKIVHSLTRLSAASWFSASTVTITVHSMMNLAMQPLLCCYEIRLGLCVIREADKAAIVAIVNLDGKRQRHLHERGPDRINLVEVSSRAMNLDHPLRIVARLVLEARV